MKSWQSCFAYACTTIHYIKFPCFRPKSTVAFYWTSEYLISNVALPETHCSTIKYITNRLDIPRTETSRFLNAGSVIDFEQYGNMHFYSSAHRISKHRVDSCWVIFIIWPWVYTCSSRKCCTVRNRGISVHALAITVNGWHLPAYTVAWFSFLVVFLWCRLICCGWMDMMGFNLREKKFCYLFHWCTVHRVMTSPNLSCYSLGSSHCH